MKVLLTGAAGCLGTYLLRSRPVDMDVVAVKFKRPVNHKTTVTADLSNSDDVIRIVEQTQPDVIIHTAYNQTDPDGSIIRATTNIVNSACRFGSELIHLSSDLLLSGNEAPYDELAPPSPIIPYGAAKAEVEEYITRHLPHSAIIRTSLILGLDPVNPSSAWVIDRLKAGEDINLFVDELRSPILADDLAAMIWELVSLPVDERGGIWNLVGPESLSRFAIGLLLARKFNLDPSVITPALNSDLSCPRPRDLRMTTARADTRLTTKARPVSSVVL